MDSTIDIKYTILNVEETHTSIRQILLSKIFGIMLIINGLEETVKEKNIKKILKMKKFYVISNVITSRH